MSEAGLRICGSGARIRHGPRRCKPEVYLQHVAPRCGSKVGLQQRQGCREGGVPWVGGSRVKQTE
eukprot:363916-Chlamydomonas_euryale.AAC.3